MILSLAACGGDDGVPSEILPASNYEARCAMPRSGTDAITGAKYVDQKGSVLDEELWLRSWTDDLYLWYSEVPKNDPTKYATALDYFDVLRTPAVTASGALKDKFHFTYVTSDWEKLSLSGTEASYGLQWALLKTKPPRELLVAFVTPGSPAAIAGMQRGTKVVTIDGVDVQSGSDTDTLNNGISPSDVNQTHTFVVQDPGATATHSIMMTSANVSVAVVQNGGLLPLAAPDDKIGYILFNTHIQPAEKGLFDAITDLSSKGATDLVLDLRYNGGGYLDIAAELGYMIAGPSSAGKLFERENFNDKHPTTDPVTGATIQPTVFHDHGQGFSVDKTMALPTLSLAMPRLFVLTGPETCSASEAVMNGLAGIGFDVIQIGDTTCGKPYGFYPFDNCSTTYFSIQFQGDNAMGFGDYPDGFVPGGGDSKISVHDGCVVEDDFTKPLGDPTEARLAAALYYRKNGACPPAAAASVANIAASARRAADRRATGPDALLDPTPLWRQNRILVQH